MNERKRSIDPAFLQKWGNVLIYCLLLFVGLLIVFGNLDAVYFGGKEFSLRAYAGNFTEEEAERAVLYAHARGKKAYAAVNIFARGEDLPALSSADTLAQRLWALRGPFSR